jgi:hypothetical protein
VNQYSFTPSIDRTYDNNGNMEMFDANCRADFNGDWAVGGPPRPVLQTAASAAVVFPDA